MRGESEPQLCVCVCLGERGRGQATAQRQVPPLLGTVPSSQGWWDCRLSGVSVFSGSSFVTYTVCSMWSDVSLLSACLCIAEGLDCIRPQTYFALFLDDPPPPAMTINTVS